MRTFKLTILALALAVGFIEGAQADPVWASHVGGTCVPDSSAIQAGRYETDGFGVRFAGNNVGTIRLLCPFGLDGTEATIGAMLMSVIDEDGVGSDGRIEPACAARSKAQTYGSRSAVAIPTHRTRQHHTKLYVHSLATKCRVMNGTGGTS
jgi:hypothetical protein